MTRLLALLCLVASAALADVPPPDSSGCNGKQAGASCKNDQDKPGSCVAAKCTRNDYSGGVPPKSVEYDCLRCTGPAEKSSSCASVPGEAMFGLAALAFTLRRRSASR